MSQSSHILPPDLAAAVDAALQQADQEQKAAAIQKALARRTASEIYEILFNNCAYEPAMTDAGRR